MVPRPVRLGTGPGGILVPVRGRLVSCAETRRRQLPFRVFWALQVRLTTSLNWTRPGCTAMWHQLPGYGGSRSFTEWDTYFYVRFTALWCMSYRHFPGMKNSPPSHRVGALHLGLDASDVPVFLTYGWAPQRTPQSHSAPAPSWIKVFLAHALELTASPAATKPDSCSAGTKHGPLLCACSIATPGGALTHPHSHRCNPRAGQTEWPSIESPPQRARLSARFSTCRPRWSPAAHLNRHGRAPISLRYDLNHDCTITFSASGLLIGSNVLILRCDRLSTTASGLPGGSGRPKKKKKLDPVPIIAETWRCHLSAVDGIGAPYSGDCDITQHRWHCDHHQSRPRWPHSLALMRELRSARTRLPRSWGLEFKHLGHSHKRHRL